MPNQASPAASPMIWALLTTGTASKSKVSMVLPGGSLASARWRSMRRRARSAISCSARAARILQSLGQRHEALSAEHDMSVLPARKGQAKVIEPMVQALAGDADGEIGRASC